MIIIKNLYKSYDQEKVLENFNYQFDVSKLYVIYGPSGIGKSTLINCITGVEPFDQGQILIDDLEVCNDNQQAILENLAYFAQDAYFIDSLTILQNLLLVNIDHNELDSLLIKFNLKDEVYKFPHQISGGQRQRFGIIRALLMKKKILILDEPTSAIDIQNRHLIFELLQSIKDDLIIICVSHDKLALDYADEVLDFKHKDQFIEREFIDTTTSLQSKHQILAYQDFFKLVKTSLKITNKKPLVYLTLTFIVSFLFLFSIIDGNQRVIKSFFIKNNINSFLVSCSYSKENLCLDKIKSYDGLKEIGNTTFGIADYNDIEQDDIIYDSLLLGHYVANFNTIPTNHDLINIKLAKGRYPLNNNEILVPSDYSLPQFSSASEMLNQYISIDLFHNKKVYQVVGIIDVSDRRTYNYLEFNHLLNKPLLFSSESDIFKTDKLESSQETNFNTRPYYAYFDNYHNSYQAFNEISKNNLDYISIFPYYGELYNNLSYIEILTSIISPLVLIGCLLSLLFFIQTKIIELTYKIDNLAIYQYIGYSFKQLKQAHITSYMILLNKLLALSFIIAVVVALVLNFIDNKLYIFNFSLFSISIIYPLFFIIIINAIAYLSLNLLFRKIKTEGWFTLIKKGRDLL